MSEEIDYKNLKIKCPKRLAAERALNDAASQWWANDGRFYDPDTSDVPWEVKWPHVAQYGYICGYKAAQQPAEDRKPQEVSVTELADSVRKAFSMWSNKDGENSREYTEVKQALAWIAHNYPNAVIVKDKA